MKIEDRILRTLRLSNQASWLTTAEIISAAKGRDGHDMQLYLVIVELGRLESLDLVESRKRPLDDELEVTEFHLAEGGVERRDSGPTTGPEPHTLKQRELA
ncbi:MAG: hypothetical protein JWO84_453 [Parcubacteria group bacterium]|nr:hypothetical protein [Parcubacteria group bacterium]